MVGTSLVVALVVVLVGIDLALVVVVVVVTGSDLVAGEVDNIM